MFFENNFVSDFVSFFEGLRNVLNYRLNVLKRAGFPRQEMNELLMKAHVALLEEKNLKELSVYYSSNNTPTYDLTGLNQSSF